MNMWTDSGFRLLSRAPPPGRTVPRWARQGHHVAAIAAQNTCRLLARLSPALPPGRFVLPYVPRCSTLRMAPSQRGTACAVAVRAEGRIEKSGETASPFPYHRTCRCVSARQCGVRRGQAMVPGHAFRTSMPACSKKDRKDGAPKASVIADDATGAICARRHNGVSASPTWGRVTTATGCIASLRRIESTMLMEAGPDSGGRIGGKSGNVKVRGGREKLWIDA